MTETLLSPEEVAARLKLDDNGPEIGAQRVLRMARRKGWPCVRLSGKLIRFSEDDVEEIIRRHRSTVKAEEQVVGLPGQTAASRARAS
ncbi:MAG: helix-turn-helix domain-containing protein [Aeromicrobium erythreum]